MTPKPFSRILERQRFCDFDPPDDLEAGPTNDVDDVELLQPRESLTPTSGMKSQTPHRRRRYPKRFESTKATAATTSAPAMATLILVTAR